MRHYISYAYKEIKNQKMATGIILLAVILATILTTVIGQAVFIMKDVMLDQAVEKNGDYHVMFTKLSEQQGKQLYNESGINKLSVYLSLGTMKLQENGIRIFFNEFPTQADQRNYGYGSKYKIEKGRLPEASNEIAMDENTLSLLKINPQLNTKVQLDGIESNPSLDKSDENFVFSGDFVLVGILENDYIGYNSSSPYINTLVGPGTCDAMKIPTQFRYTIAQFQMKNLKSIDMVTNQIFKALKMDESKKDQLIAYNSEYLSLLGANFNGEALTIASETKQLAVQMVFIVLLVLVAAGLVIYNVLKLFIMKRVNNYAVLRSMGAKKHQIIKIVLSEVLMLCTVGIPIGILLGILSAKGLLEIVLSGNMNAAMFLADDTKQLLKAVRLQSCVHPLVILLVFIVIPLFSVLATIPTAIYAAKVPPIVVMQGEKHKIHKYKTFRYTGNINRKLAFIHLRRNQTSSIVTIFSLSIGIAVFLILNSYLSTLNLSVDISANPDFYLSNVLGGIPQETIKSLQEDSKVKTVMVKNCRTFNGSKKFNGLSSIKTSIEFPYDAYKLNIIGLDERYLKHLYKDIDKNTLKAFLEGEVCFVNGVREMFNETKKDVIPIGKKLTVQDHSFTVGGTIDGFNCVYGEPYLLGIDLFISNDAFNEIIPEANGSSNEIDIYVNNKTNTSVLKEKLSAIASENPGTKLLATEEGKEQAKDSFKKTQIIAWGFIIFIFAISILNIMNTTYTNIETGRREASILRAIGMSQKKLKQMYLWENIYLGLAACIIGGGIGISGGYYLLVTNHIIFNLSNAIIQPFIIGSILTISCCCLFSLFFARNTGNNSTCGIIIS